MNYIDLDRHFAPLKKGEEPALDYTPHWGRRVGGWLNWEQLLQQRRVALLAEALSGKTWELEHQVKVLREQQKPAFFVRIEDLADGGFETALDAADVAAFHEWKESSVKEAWFFLDSVDEARLNHKSFPKALRAFKNELGQANLNRSFVFISCRVSDWKGVADVQAIQNALPFEEQSPADSSMVDADDELLAPIFQANPGNSITAKSKKEPAKPSDLLVVQLIPLSPQQKILMAEAAGTDGPAFIDAVRQSGLDSLSERPGDLLELLEYWGEHGHFAPLREMMNSSVDRKLRELNPDRGGAGLLSLTKAREGAQRLAGALTLVQTFSIKGPQQEPDPTLAKGALDASVILDDWSAGDLGALLRTGLFAPSTYGRIKFHHRGTQEYLTARWLNSLTAANLPYTELRQLLFADRYGVATAVPTLLPVSAWLAQWNDRVRDDLATREPVALIAHGDAKSLPLQTKEKLLGTYATLDAKGELDADQVSYRAAWMFSEPALGPVIQKAWRANQRPSFRYQLLNFILEGRIASCMDIAREASTARTGGNHMRLTATQALAACNDAKGLKAVANQLRTAPDLYGVSAAPGVIDVLYPRYLSTRDVVQLIDRLKSDDKYAFENFGRHLADLHALAPDRAAKAELVAGIAEIVTRGGLVDEHDDKPPTRRTDLDEGLASLILAELRSSGSASSDLISIMMVYERAGHLINGEDDNAAVAAAVRQSVVLNRALMWADEKARRQADGSATPPLRYFSIGPHLGRSLWSIELDDVEWLKRDAVSMSEESQRRLAFHALWWVYQYAGEFDAHRGEVESLAAHEAVLQADLQTFVVRPPDELRTESAARLEARKKTEADKQAWRNLSQELSSQPTLLSSPENLATWQAGLHRLWNVTHWIHLKSRKDGFAGMHSWKAVAQVFGPEVLKHYLLGMSAAWRRITPERPSITASNTYSTKAVNTLAVNALQLEGLANSNWPATLTPAEIEVAAKHLLMSSNVRLPQFSQLGDLRPDLLKPIVVDALRAELRSGGHFQDLLSHASHGDSPFLLESAAEEVLRQLQKKEPDNKDTLGQCVTILKRAASGLPSKTLLRLAQKRVETHLLAKDQDRVFTYLSLLSVLDGEALAKKVLRELAQCSGEGDAEHTERVRTWLGSAFDYRSSSGFAHAALRTMSVASLVDFVRLAYRHIHPSTDQVRNSTSGRDRAEGARSTLLDTLIKRPGPQAHAAMLQLASEPDFAVSSMRFKELAHHKAQMDSDLTPWTADEVRSFGTRFSAPVKNGAQFMGVVRGILEEIADELRTKDASTRLLLAMADNEKRVQEWLAERIEEKSRGRYGMHREVEVANRNEPDLALTSHAASVEVAMEVKNANMGWTFKELVDALIDQLSEKYLLPEKRRHGFLVISLHKRRTWRVAGKTLSFEQVIERMNARARTITSNRTGDIEVAVIGLNAAAK